MHRGAYFVAVAVFSYRTSAQFVPSACNPLTAVDSSDPAFTCFMPWPSDHFQARTWDPSAPLSLKHINSTTLPHDNTGKGIDAAAGGYSALTGFSPSGGVLAYIPGA